MKVIFIALFFFSLFGCSSSVEQSTQALTKRSIKDELSVHDLYDRKEFVGQQRKIQLWKFGKKLPTGDYFHGGWITMVIPDNYLEEE